MAEATRIERLILDELEEPEDFTPRPDTHDDFSVEAIADKAVAAKDGSVAKLAGLYHSARLAANYPAQLAGAALAEARDIYPSPPPEICDPGAPLFPSPDWPHWRVDLFKRWNHQCRLIDKGLGLGLVEAASAAADELRDDLGVQAVEAEAKTASDVRAKLGVICWRVEIEDLEPAETVRLLRCLAADLDRVAAIEKQPG